MHSQRRDGFFRGLAIGAGPKFPIYTIYLLRCSLFMILGHNSFVQAIDCLWTVGNGQARHARLVIDFYGVSVRTRNGAASATAVCAILCLSLSLYYVCMVCMQPVGAHLLFKFRTTFHTKNTGQMGLMMMMMMMVPV